MIIKVNRLTNFGNYRQFQWGSTANFTKYNLIYGWNYSGKTTLSRLFQVLAMPTELTQWQGCQFEVELQGGAKLTQVNLANPLRIKVFNRDFIQSNFQQEHKAPAVFIVGGSTIHLRNRITRLNEHLDKTRTIEAGLNERHQQLKKELDSLGTTHASFVATFKLDLLFDTDVERTEIQKFSDDASHLQGLNRALQQPDFISNAQNTVKKVIQALKAKDNPHYISMCTVIGVAP